MKAIVLLVLFALPLFASAQSVRDLYVDSANAARDETRNIQASIYREKAYQESLKIGDSLLIASDLISLGTDYRWQEKLELAMEYYLRGLRMAERSKKKDADTVIENALVGLSFYFMEVEDFKSAETYLNRLKKIGESNNNKVTLARYYSHRGILDRRMGKTASAILCYQKALELIPKSKEHTSKRFEYMINLSTAYYYNGEFSEAIRWIERAEEENLTIGSGRNTIIVYASKGQFYLRSEQLDSALFYFEKCLEFLEDGEWPDFKQRVYRSLARTHYKLGNYKTGYDLYVKFVKMQQTAFDEKTSNTIAEMNAKYEHDRKEAEILNLKKQNELESQLYESQLGRRNWFIAAIAVFVLFAGLGLFGYMRWQRNKQRAEVELMETRAKLELQESEMRGQEEERDRLSRELHDGLGGVLASIKVRLSAKSIDGIEPILADIDNACQEVRNVSHGLNSNYIRETKFSELLEELQRDIQKRTNLNVQVDVLPKDAVNSMTSEQAHHSYRIIQELTQNTIKHANASQLIIGVLEDEGVINLHVEDDGKGFDEDKEQSGIGMMNIQYRVEQLNGELTVNSTRETGTAVDVQFPLT